MKIYYDRGIVVEDSGTKLYLDPELSSTPIKHPTFVTHAHSDHTAAVSGSSLSYMTQTTHQLYDITSKRNARNYQFVEFHKPFEIGPFEIEFLHAGHLLGAAQILIRHGSHSFLYTGDFCPEDLLTVQGAEIPSDDVDLTIMDATYGDKLINFDTRPSSRQNLFIWIIQQLGAGKIPMINVGHLGGAQEIISLLNKLASNMPVVVNQRVAKVCKVYEEVGVDLDYHTFDSEDIKSLIEDKCVILVPRNFKKVDALVRRFRQLDGKISRAIVTGQSAKYGFSSFNYASALSTHAHYDELVDVAKALNPKHILTHYGYHEELANSLYDKYKMSAESFSLAKPVDVKKLDRIEIKPRKKSDNFFQHTPLDQYF